MSSGGHGRICHLPPRSKASGEQALPRPDLGPQPPALCFSGVCVNCPQLTNTEVSEIRKGKPASLSTACPSLGASSAPSPDPPTSNEGKGHLLMRSKRHPGVSRNSTAAGRGTPRAAFRPGPGPRVSPCRPPGRLQCQGGLKAGSPPLSDRIPTGTVPAEQPQGASRQAEQVIALLQGKQPSLALWKKSADAWLGPMKPSSGDGAPNGVR